MRTALPRLRKTAALLATTAGLASLAAVAAPAASAAPARPTAHRLHLHHLNHTAQAADRHAAQDTASRAAARPVLATTPTGATGAAGARALAQSMVPASQWAAFDAIVSHESGWNPGATNASSGAYGLGQALPGSKMASAGADWRTNPATQIRWALDYMNSRYGSPNAAWAFWQTHHWY
ncbi:lytic transglycosylase domain-containing protein [Streptacidiphilus sp. ASG 303]|uniref:aggregation-promoting factor C-terminal-like domain-containing protein n=1 Tax=Streptacidiphilus sp. ASG 303 TaxID=2896847 RepID=UPI001E361443|nr:transglycosylase SLT domain-containing protein [Streptacidiphilus sp. ASG 303]MCD0486498.1 lytic transglycosylase domain-containing protein [Streptacidiphilus sp. ASG 303]